MFALVDCNNFYASCERVFQPHLKHTPIVVLSNNDGCIIARSNEAKALGVPMGAPYHQSKELMQREGVAVFSSNYQYYGDMSQRVMQSLEMFVPDIEVYSIDEAFLKLDKMPVNDWMEYGIKMREKVLQWTGIPTSVGIAPTKTLAKVANHYAKKHTAMGVFDMMDMRAQEKILTTLPVSELWGVGKQWSKKLNYIGIHTAAQLRDTDPRFIRKHFSVVGERMVRELRGVSCLGLEDIQPRKNIMSSKSFGRMVTDLDEMSEAISTYAVRACHKLRGQRSRACAIHVFLQTNRFRQNMKQYANSTTIEFVNPTNDTGQIIKAAKEGLRRIYRAGYWYKKCGLMLMNIQPASQCQNDLFAHVDNQRSDALMKAMDSLDTRYGTNAVFYASQGIERSWQMRSDKRSPRYTTQWGELLTLT